MSDLAPGDIVHVVWQDSCSGGGWRDDEHVDRALVCQSVGRVALDGNEVLVLEANWHGEDEEMGTAASHCGSMAIPRTAILSVEKMRERAGVT